MILIATENNALDPVTVEALDVLRDVLNKDYDTAVEAIAALDTVRDTQSWKWIAPYATTTVMWSLWCFLNHMDNYEASIVSAIVCGGDVDSTAAICGAISGARLGIDAIPTRYLDHLHDRGTTCKVPELIEIATAFYEASIS